MILEFWATIHFPTSGAALSVVCTNAQNRGKALIGRIFCAPDLGISGRQEHEYWVEWTKNNISVSAYSCGRADPPKNAPESTPLWFVAFWKFCITVGGVLAAVSVFVNSTNISTNIEAARCLLRSQNYIVNFFSVLVDFIVCYRYTQHWVCSTFFTTLGPLWNSLLTEMQVWSYINWQGNISNTLL